MASPFRLLAPLAVLLAAAVGGCTAPAAPAVASDDSWTYVGDAACASCHADVTTSYHATGMGQSVSRFDPVTAPEQFDAQGRSPVVCAEADGYCYQAELRGDSLFIRETHPDWPDHERVIPVSHVIGSGNATRSYLMAAGGGAEGDYLTEMPLTWYVERRAWDLSPGYTQRNSRFERPITLECLTCHDARPGWEKSQNFYTDVPLGISCERCHGPGSAHVAAFESGEPEDPQILDLASLSVARQFDVCQQCHLVGETVFAPGEDPTTYRPGRPLSAHRAVFVTDASLEDPDAFGISSQVERLTRSECFIQSADTERPMTCTTCHDPHVPTASLPPDHFADACRTCHGTVPDLILCTRPGTTTRQAALSGDCASCHMRRGGTKDIPHVSFTDHWIRMTPPPGRSGGPTEDAFRRETPFRLVNLATGGGPETMRPAEADVALGMATFVLYETMHPLPAYLPEVVARIRSGLAAGVDRPEARVVLGRALLEMGSAKEAVAALAEAVRQSPESADAHLWLGVARLRGGDAAGAAGALAEAVRLAPRYTEARLQLARALADAGRTAEAAAALDAALRQDPERHAGAWNDLGFFRLQMGQADAALAALRRAVALDALQPTARANLGTALLARGDLPAATAQLEAALRLDARNEAALGNLGLIRAQQGRTADARALFERLLAVNPQDARAADALRQLGP